MPNCTQIDRIVRENKLSKVCQNYCGEKVTFLVKRCCSLFTLWFPANTSLNQSCAGKQFDTYMYPSGGGNFRATCFWSTYKITVI